MALAYLILIIILLPILFPEKYKTKGVIVSFILLFLLFGLQYQMTRDWPVYVDRWYQATENRQFQSFELESLYSLIMRLCKPFGFFVYLMICAIFNLSVFYKYLQKYVPLKWAWLMLAIFLLRVNFALTYIDTNRQTLAITFVMLGLFWFLNPPMHINKQKKLYLIFFAMLLGAVNIHTAAYIALPLLFFPLICSKIKSEKWLYIFVGIYVFSFFVDFSQLSVFVDLQMRQNDGLEQFSHYAEEIANREKSIVEQGFYFALLVLLIKNFMEFKDNEKPVALAVIVFISLQGYAMYTMFRALFFYQVYSVYIIPILFYRLMSKKKYKTPTSVFLVLFLSYCIFSFSRDIKHENLEGWRNFTTILTAPKWM